VALGHADAREKGPAGFVDGKRDRGTADLMTGWRRSAVPIGTTKMNRTGRSSNEEPGKTRIV